MKTGKKKMLVADRAARLCGEINVDNVLPKMEAEAEAADVPKVLPGKVHVQWVRCGRAGCRCAQGQLHGPYYYRFWREGGRLRKEYVKRADLEGVIAACQRRQSELQREREFKQAVREQIKKNSVRWRLLLEGIKRLQGGEW